jgi:hypothetical protein
VRPVRRLLFLALVGVRCGCSPSGSADATSSTGQDATDALQQALAGGGTVTIAGSDTFVVRSVAVVKPGTTIVCSGTPTPATLKLRPLDAGDGAPILDIRAGHFTLQRCILDGNRSAQPPGGFRDSFDGRAFRAAIRMDGQFSGLTVDGVAFRNVYGAAIAARNVSAISVRNSKFLDDNFEAVFADNSYSLGDPQGSLGGFTFVGNSIVNVGSHDGRVNANGLLVHQMSDVRVDHNSWTGYERSAVKLENCRSGSVAHNRIRGGSLPNFAAITMQNGAHDLTVRDNDILQVGAGIDTSLVAGGQYPPDAVTGVTISGNTIDSVQPGDIPDGIRILGYGPNTTDVTIAGNVIQNVPRSGINLRQFRVFHPSPVFSRITIEGNVLTSAGSCTDFFRGSPVAPTDVTSSGNRCD